MGLALKEPIHDRGHGYTLALKYVPGCSEEFIPERLILEQVKKDNTMEQYYLVDEDTFMADVMKKGSGMDCFVVKKERTVSKVVFDSITESIHKARQVASAADWCASSCIRGTKDTHARSHCPLCEMEFSNPEDKFCLQHGRIYDYCGSGRKS